ncbi:MAG: AMP-binding protein [Tannerella sp.]|jgi:acyl-coenzyme A synthetase/AMP-(fatty) acid ligase|nr:AMP-binding protein [Tannerella sp.]
MSFFPNNIDIGKIALTSDTNESLTYRELRSFSENIRIYVKPRTTVFCLCKNEMGALVGYYSFLENKAVPVMLDANSDYDLLSNLLEIYRPNYIWAPDSFAIKTSYACLFKAYNYSLIPFSGEKIELYSDLALLLTTSGSTGSPKLVRLSYNNILSNAEAIAEYLNIDSNERPVTSLPIHYSYGLSVINSHLIKGASILLTDKLVVQKEFWNFAREQKATSMAGVPYTYEILKRLRIFCMDLPELKTFTQAGGKLNAELTKEYIEQAKTVGKRFIVMYGQTEATARMSYLPFDNAAEKYCSIGIPISGGKFALRDEPGNEITEPYRDGELVYSGPNVSLGYAESKEDLAKGDENNGILYTGDIAHYDNEGFYYITGRKKRFVKIFGNRVNLDAVEQLIKNITPSCTCVGVDDKITVFTTENKEEEIKSLLVKKTGLNIRAFAVQIIDATPKNASGKIRYAELIKRISE